MDKEVKMNKNKTFMGWIKKYGTYCVAGFLVLAIGLTIIFTAGTSKETQANISSANNPVISVGGQPVVSLSFQLPMTEASLLKEFSSQELFYNQTLERWEYHDGVDLVSSDLSVFASADGKVSSVSETYADGKMVIITHENGFQSVYSCLADDVLVEEGDEVKAGDKIGTAGESSNNEQKDGAHLHFELLQDGKNIDPASYLNFENK